MNKIRLKIKNFLEYIRKGGVVYINKLQPMSFDQAPLSGKIAFVTGGSSGIGLEIAKGLSDIGAKVIISGRNSEKLEEVSKEFGFEWIKWDIRDITKANDYMSGVFSAYKTVDILINCAGIYDGARIEEVSVESYDKLMETNMKGMYFLTQEYIRHLDNKDMNSDIKRIINILSINSVRASTDVYAMSKWQGLCFTKGLAKEMVNRNIIVNAVAPGQTISNINSDNRIDPAKNVYDAGNIRAKYYFHPENIANVVKFLSTDFSNGIVGQCIIVDGGETLL